MIISYVYFVRNVRMLIYNLPQRRQYTFIDVPLHLLLGMMDNIIS